MLREDLEVLFCFKIGKELEQFKGEIEKMDLDEILARAYQVDAIITIYELLLEMSRLRYFWEMTLSSTKEENRRCSS